MIAERLGVTPQGAGKIVRRALATLVPDVDEMTERRQMMQVRIDMRRLAAAQVLAREHPVLHQGQPVTVGDRNLDDDGVKLQALDRLRAADHDEARLWGLDAAEKFEHTGAQGGPVEVEHWVTVQQERIAKIRLMPRQAVDATSHDLEEREEA